MWDNDWGWDIEDFKIIGNDRIWVTNDGLYINVKDMSTTHIENCINMLERSNICGDYDDDIDILKKELSKRERLPFMEQIEKMIGDYDEN